MLAAVSSYARVAGAALLALLIGQALARAAGEADPLAALERAMAAAEASLQGGDPAAAEGRHREALVEGWMVLGTLHRLEGRAAAAREAFAEALRLAPGHRAALLSLAASDLNSGTPAAAVELLDPAARQGGDLELLILLARALAAQGEAARALSTLDEAGTRAGDAEAQFRLASEYLWLGASEPAERLFARVLEARPLPQTHVLIGRTYRDAGRYEQARSHLRAALAQDPRVRRAHYYLGMVALADAREGPERLERAIAEFGAELELDPQDALASHQLGVALLEAGRPEQARPRLEAAARSDPRMPVLLHLGRAWLALERPAEAAETLRRALEAHDGAEPDLEAVHYQLGLALRKLGRPQEAAVHLAEARRLASRPAEPAPAAAPVLELTPLAGRPRSELPALRARAVQALARASFNLGVMRAQARDFAAATELLGRAAELQPEMPRVHYSLGVAAFNAARYEQAVAPLERALAEQPDSAELHVVLGQARAHLGRHAEAEEALTRALRLKADVAEARSTLGLVYLAQDRLDEAEAELRAGLRANPEDAAARQGLDAVLARRAERRRQGLR